MNPHFSTAPFWVGNRSHRGSRIHPLCFGSMLSAKVPQRRGERTALQAERPHAAGGKICDIMDVRETLISKK